MRLVTQADYRVTSTQDSPHEPHPNAEPPKIHRVGVPDCCHVGETTVAAAPVAVSANAHASDTVPGEDVATERNVHAEPATSEIVLAARTATIDTTVAAAVVMMSGVGTRLMVAVGENPDCT